MLFLTQKRLKMYIRMHMNHNLIIMSLLGGKETRSSQGLEEIMAIGEKWSCGVRRTSGEQGSCLGERPKLATVNVS